eukprot:scaffold354_cov234-Pinguiococcus_pyrenoidosus.AAC.1
MSRVIPLGSVSRTLRYQWCSSSIATVDLCRIPARPTSAGRTEEASWRCREASQGRPSELS